MVDFSSPEKIPPYVPAEVKACAATLSFQERGQKIGLGHTITDTLKGLLLVNGLGW
jgi:hypothetical protein